MSKYTGFTVIVQCHDQPPIDSKAYRPVFAREFLPGIKLSEVWDWIEKVRIGQVESVMITKLEF